MSIIGLRTALNIRISTFAFALICVCAPVNGQTYPTIVGEWYTEDHPEDCGSPMSTKIQPMAIIEDVLVCTFNDVARSGWEVTWHGSCSDGRDESRSKVVALETNGRLFLTFNGNSSPTALRRCNANTGAIQPPRTERIPLQYVEYKGDTENARRYFPDTVEAIGSFDGRARLADKLSVYVAEVGIYTFAMAMSVYDCGTGSHGCPVEVFEGEENVGEFTACQALDQHAISADGKTFYDCEHSNGRVLASLIQ